MEEFRGLIHIHSSYSYDGKVSIPDLAELCRIHAYRFMVVTEHAEKNVNKDNMQMLVSECESLSSNDLIIIPGLEFVCMGDIHILGLGIKKYLTASDPRKVIRGIHNQGGLAVLAHASYYKKIPYEILNELDGVEIWNLKYDGRLSPKLRCFKILKKFKNENENIIKYAGLDLHKSRDFGKLSIYIKAKKVTEKEIMIALKKGNFYMTNGLTTLYPRKELKFYEKFVFAVLNLLHDTRELGLVSGKKVLKLIGVRPPKALSKIIYRIF